MGRRMDSWKNEWLEEEVNGRMDERMRECLEQLCRIIFLFLPN